MKNKMFCLAIIICSLFGARCTEDQKMDYLYPDYIEINFNNSNYQANLQLFIEASKRFDEHVYKDENKGYKTSINKGSDIRISEDLFNLLTKSLKYRGQIEGFKNKKINMSIENTEGKLPSAKSYPICDYDQWVYGQLNYLWNEIIGTWNNISDAQIYYFSRIIGIAAISAFEYFFSPFLWPGPLLPPSTPYNGRILFAGDSFQTSLPDGLYPCKSPSLGIHQYVAVRNGIARVRYCEQGPFSWYRRDHGLSRYYQTRDRDLL